MCWLVLYVSSGTFEIWKEDSFRSTSGFHFYNVVSEFQVCFRFPFLFTMWPALRWISFRSTLTQHWSAPRLGCLLLFQRKNRWVSSSIWNPDQQQFWENEELIMTRKLKEPVKEGSCTDWFFCRLLEESRKPNGSLKFLKNLKLTLTLFWNFATIPELILKNFKNLESEVITKSRTHPTLVHLVRTREIMFPFARFIVQSTFQGCLFWVLFWGILSCSSSKIIHSAVHSK